MKDDAMAAAIEDDWRTADLSEERRAMLTYAEKLTRSPGEMTEDDVDALREAGLTDEDVLHVCEIVAYYAYANRIADGLGVGLEPWIPEIDD